MNACDDEASKESERQNKKFKELTESKIEFLVIKMGIPTIMSMLTTSFYNMADTFFVSKVNTQSTAAVGIVFSMMAIIQAIGFFFGHGSGNYISIKLGAKETDEASKMAATGFLSAMIVGFMILIFGIIFIKPLAYLLGSTETILPYSISYMKYILIGAPYMTASLVLNNQLRLQGNALFAMIGLITGAILNIILDPILIFHFSMGVKGAAIGTIISQFVGFCILLIGTNVWGTLPIKLKDFSPSLQKYKAIIVGGLPSLCRQSISSFSTAFLNTSASAFGDAAIAAMSIVNRIAMFANSAIIGFGQGFQPVCGFNYGAKKYDRVIKAFYFCVKISTLVLFVLAFIIFINSAQIVHLFNDKDEVLLDTAYRALRYQAFSLPLWGFITLSSMMLQTTRKTIRASILAVAKQGIFFIPIIYIFPKFFGLIGIEIAQPFSDLLTFILAIPLGYSIIREMKYELQSEKSL
ncbi:MATE family efflux transporter [Brachyspira hampsonii]|uniref:MATE family efflux transporter n=1 Tax=Brachyspira hampsonii TaxID=1287055 RepID=UPI001C67305F|nr:MATE family efflux transporter [Brachyspira hampsonii]MBW5390870.1 MATE family efflux transporter [Brachyspira hampsonii]